MKKPVSPDSNTPVASLKNLGPKTAKMLNEIGIFTLQDLESIGPIMAYHILRHRFKGVNVLFLYGMYGALNDCHWNHLPPGVKEELNEAAAHPIDIIHGPSE